MKISVLIYFLLLSYLSFGQLSTPNFLIIMADDCTFRDLEVYGGQARTPNLNKLAEEGMKFKRCFQATAMCAPTRQNLLTGIYPVRNGAYANHTQTHSSIKSIVHHMEPAGYQLALTGKRHIGPASVYPFEYSKNDRDPDLNFIKSFISNSNSTDKPFCLFAMCSSPHVPWTYGDSSHYPIDQLQLPPYLIDTKETRQAYAMYLAEIEYFDWQVGQILQLLKDSGHEDKTVVFVLSEQGNLFPFEKWTCYDAGLQSALVVRYPEKIKRGSVTNAMVEYVDITPTILDLAGIKPIIELDGRSFKEVLFEKSNQHKQMVFGVQTTSGVNEASQPFGIRSVRNDSLKYILNLFPENQFENALLMDPEKWSDSRRSYLWWMNSWRKVAENDEKAKYILDRYQKRPVIELYHVLNDPYELVNVALDPKYKAVREILHQELMTWMDQQGDQGRETELNIEIKVN